LEIDGSPRKYDAWIPTRFVSALDLCKSLITETAFVKTVRKPVISLERARGSDIFALEGFPFAGVYVTDAFVKRVKRSNLIGLRFEQVETTQ